MIRFVKFSVVRSTGWVPERILATRSGARNASGIRWIQSLPYCGLQIGLHARAQAAAYGEWANDLRPPTFRAECGKAACSDLSGRERIAERLDHPRGAQVGSRGPMKTGVKAGVSEPLSQN